MKIYDLDVIMISAGMNMSGETIPSGKSLGGSETCSIQLSEALARRGHHVTLFCSTEKPHSANGVFYTPIGWVQNKTNGSMFPKGFFDFARSMPSDAVIVQRMPQLLGFEFNSKVNILWQHDLATRTGPSNFHGVLWNIDKIIVPSLFMQKQYQKVHGGPDKLYSVFRNGIDLGLIDSTEKNELGGEIERDRFRLTYTSRPERGLEHLLRDVFPQILAKEPRARLYLSRYEDPAVLPLYQQLEERMAQFGDRVVNLKNLGKRDLYHNYRKSRLLLYPSAFEEISMLTLNEMGACGGVMIGPWRAALPETAAGAHVLLKEDGASGREGDATENGFCDLKPEFIRAFVDETVSLMHDDERWEGLSRAARKRAEQWTWDGIVDSWVDLIHEKIAARSSELRRMIKHFIFNSDIVAAKKFAAQTGNQKYIESVDSYIRAYVPFVAIDDPEERRKAINEFYEQRSGGGQANYRTAFWADREPRLQVLLNWMRQKVEAGELVQDANVLDFGCAHGGYVRVLSNEFPRMRFVGVDNSPSLVRCANELLKSQMPDGSAAFRFPRNVNFHVGDENWRIYGTPGVEAQNDLVAIPGEFDLVVCMEVLEHLPHAEEVVGKLENLCKQDGFMVFTVPFGHLERNEMVIKGAPPVHVRAFDLHDLRDMFKTKKGYGVISFSSYTELQLDKTMPGWFMVTYQNDRRGVGQIDWERKFFMQGPRETMAVCMIVHNNEDVLHRCLRSVNKLADQLIVVDNGPSSDRTAMVAREYTDDVRAGTNPFWCYKHLAIHAPEGINPDECEMAGFETPRNESVEGVWTDWICFVPGTQIRTRGGFKPIESVQVGDEVLTHMGRFRRVSQLHERKYSGEIVSLRPAYSDNVIRMTPNHPLLGTKNFQCYIHGKLCFPECQRQWAYYRKSPRTTQRMPADGFRPVENCQQGYQHYDLTWMSAESFEKRDIVVYQSVLPERIETLRLDLSEFVVNKDQYDISESTIRPKNGNAKTVKRFVECDEEFWRLCGYYLAEGFTSEDNWTICFAFHRDEHLYHDEVETFMLRYFGLKMNSKILPIDSKSATLIFASKPVAEFFGHFLGRGVDNKRLPDCAINITGMQAFNLFLGSLRGDGTEHPDSYKIVSNSRLLIYQLRDIVVRFGIVAGVRRHDKDRTRAWVLHIGGAGLNRLSDFGLHHRFIDERTEKGGINDDGWTDGGRIYFAVRDVSREIYSGPVYNLGVEEDNSYQAEDIIVHNCWIDSDEQLLEPWNVWKYLRPNVFNGLALQQHHISVDPPGAIKRDIPVRLFRNNIGMKCWGLVHEHFEFGINKGVGAECFVPGDFHIHHDGYLTESIRRGRFARNLKLLECDRRKYPDRLLGIYLYEIRDNSHLANYALEKSGGVVTEEVARHCRTVIDNFQKNFLAKDVLLAEDGMEYYSRALAIMGLGIEVLVDVDIKKAGASFSAGAKRFRVMNAEEAKKVVDRKIEALSGPLEGPYVS